jgi:hypothetical protein
MNWWHFSSGRKYALQAKSPEFKPSLTEKRKKKDFYKNKTFTMNFEKSYQESFYTILRQISRGFILVS